MFWIIGPIVIIVLVFLRGFRKTALGLLVGAVIAGALVYRHIHSVERQAAARMSVAEISVQNVAVRRTFDSSYELTGTIRNNSAAYRVDAVSFDLAIRDCPPGQTLTCVIIGKTAVRVPVTVPPKQLRDFTATLYFGKAHTPAKGTLAWNYEVTAVFASRQQH
jgi:hypothetical protein